MKKYLLASALVLATASGSALAGGFVRVEAGRSHGNIDVSGLGSESDNDSTYSVRGGYWFNPNFAVEGFYTDAFDKSYSDGIDTANLKATAIGLGVVGKKNFGADGNGFFIDGRAGVARGKLEASVTGLGSESDTSIDPYFGVGAGYDFSQSLGLGLSYDYLKSSGQDVDVTVKTLTLGVEFRF